MLAWLLGGVLAVSLSVSVVTDLRSRRIPNLVTLPAFAAALLLRLALGGWDAAADGLLGALIAFAPFFALAWAGGMGMGDVKLVAAVGACVGAERILWALFCIALVGGLQGLAALLWSGTSGRTKRGRVTVPYGVAIALGTAWAMAWRPWLGA